MNEVTLLNLPNYRPRFRYDVPRKLGTVEEVEWYRFSLWHRLENVMLNKYEMILYVVGLQRHCSIKTDTDFTVTKHDLYKCMTKTEDVYILVTC